MASCAPMMVAGQQPAANFVLLPYHSHPEGIQLAAAVEPTAQWIVNQLSSVKLEQLESNSELYARTSFSFKEELLTNLAAQSPQPTSSLESFFRGMAPHDLFLEMVFNTNRYLILSGLSWLERCLPIFCNGTPNENLVVKVFQLVHELRSKILLFLNHWRSSQATGSPLPSCAAGLDTIQPWFERLFAFSWTVLCNGTLAIQREQWKHLAEMLLNDGFLIGEQPSQVVRTGTNCQVTLHHLVGETLQNKLRICGLKVFILAESQSQKVQQGGIVPPERNNGHLEYEDVSLVYDSQTRMMSAEIKNLKVKKIIRPNKRGQECVLDDKFALLFCFTAESGDFSFTPRVLSLPVVVIVHANQDTQAWATVAWDIAGFEINRVPFYVPTRLYWAQVANMLSRKFEITAGRGLSVENVHSLCEKAVRETFTIAVPEEQIVTWSQFCKECLPDRNFSFWDWFHAALKVTKDHLKQHWMAGYVFAFISKSRAEEYLRGRPAGTFILRFSDSFEGRITIAYVTAALTVRHLQPFTPKEMECQPLGEIVNGMDYLHWVYPDVPKAAAFDANSPTPPPANIPPGYVGRRIRHVVDPPANGSAELGAGNDHQATDQMSWEDILNDIEWMENSHQTVPASVASSSTSYSVEDIQNL